MAQSVTVKGLDELIGSLQDVAEDFPRVRREFHEAVTEEIREEVLKSLGSRAKSNTGKVAGWQESVVGTLGGYAAMRPRKGKDDGEDEGKGKKGKGKKDKKSYAYGYITNAIESGHAISRPRNNRKRYRARIKKRYVLGLHFYERAKPFAEKRAIDGANRLADTIKQKMEEKA